MIVCILIFQIRRTLELFSLPVCESKLGLEIFANGGTHGVQAAGPIRTILSHCPRYIVTHSNVSQGSQPQCTFHICVYLES